METQLSIQTTPPPTTGGVEAASKILASAVLVIYACGFLVTSIHDFQYGFSEMNPFRPRILTAGAWFFLFLAVPFELVRRLSHTGEYKRAAAKGFPRLVDLSFAYVVSCNFILWASRPIFNFDSDPASAESHFQLWKFILGGSVLLSLIFIVVRYSKKWSEWVKTGFTATMLLVYCWGAFSDFYLLGRFRGGATILWLLAVGALCAFELTARSGKPELGDWPQTLVALLALLLIFGTRYYPHILSSWGGGTPIPITISYTKDAVKLQSKDIGYLLVDETDAGFYVVGLDDKAAIFIPRANVGMVRFSSSFSGKGH